MDVLLSALTELLTPEGGWSLKLLARILLSTAILFFYVVLLARTFGSRTFASFTSYDFLTNVAAGSLVASAILGKSIMQASLSLLILVLLQYGVSAWSAHSTRAQSFFDNEPLILVENGVMRENVMKRARVSRAMLDQQLRSAGLTDLTEVKFAVLESGGTISIVKHSHT